MQSELLRQNLQGCDRPSALCLWVTVACQARSGARPKVGNLIFRLNITKIWEFQKVGGT